MKLLTLVIILGVAQVSSIQLKCRISLETFIEDNGKSSTLYVCKVLNFSPQISRKNEKVEICVKESNGSDCFGQRGLAAENLTILYFPRGLETTVGNLEVIYIQSCKLQAIEEEDLKPFPDLMDINLQSNEIEVLGIDLFDHNQKLQMINLADNKISKIHPKIFHNLDHLQGLSLVYNPCADNGSLAFDVKNPLEVKKRAIDFVNWCNWYTAKDTEYSKQSPSITAMENCKNELQQSKNIESTLQNNLRKAKNEVKNFKNKNIERSTKFINCEKNEEQMEKQKLQIEDLKKEIERLRTLHSEFSDTTQQTTPESAIEMTTQAQSTSDDLSQGLVVILLSIIILILIFIFVCVVWKLLIILKKNKKYLSALSDVKSDAIDEPGQMTVVNHDEICNNDTYEIVDEPVYEEPKEGRSVIYDELNHMRPSKRARTGYDVPVKVIHVK